MKIKEPSSGREEWITPGGKIGQTEDLATGLCRELTEETGGESFQVGPLIWTRHNTYEWEGHRVSRHEEYYLVQTRAFQPTSVNNRDEMERRTTHQFRWWSVAEMKTSTDQFGPSILADLLESIFRDGVPQVPIHIDS